MAVLLVVLFVAILLLIIDIVIETRFPKIVEVQMETNRIASRSELRILHVTDLHHLALPASFVEKLTRTKPDLIVVTGDLINGNERNFDREYSFVERLAGICPHLFFVSGNNDWEHLKYQEFLLGLEQRGMTVLNNGSCRVSTGGISVNVVGVDDPSKWHDHIAKAYAGVQDDSLYTVLLAHDPLIMRRTKQFRFDLILCGHTHGGQIRLPILGALIAPGQGLLPKYDKGKFALGEQTILYIDSGLGTSKVPIRFWNRSQVSLLRVQGMGR